jgi:hypothetical protein
VTDATPPSSLLSGYVREREDLSNGCWGSFPREAFTITIFRSGFTGTWLPGDRIKLLRDDDIGSRHRVYGLHSPYRIHHGSADTTEGGLRRSICLCFQVVTSYLYVIQIAHQFTSSPDSVVVSSASQCGIVFLFFGISCVSC